MKGLDILIVGGAGYLGRHLSAYLSAVDHRVVITGTKDIPGANYHKIVFGDTESYRTLKDLKFDISIILASGLKSLGTTDLNHPDLVTNTTGYASFLQYMADEKITGKIIYTSSMTVYDPGNLVPVTEQGKIGPVSTYSLSKYIAETITDFYCRSNNIHGAVLRLPGIYGGDRKSGFIYNTIAKLKAKEPLQFQTKGLHFWETIHVDDLCEMFADFIEAYSWKEQVSFFNFGYGEETDFYRTAEFLRNAISPEQPIPVEAEKGYVPFYLSNDKLKQLIHVKSNYYQKLKAYIQTCEL